MSSRSSPGDAPTVVFWDIDGTLLSTGRAGIRAWEQALSQVVGREADLSQMRTSGLTDPMIAREILVASDRAPDIRLEQQLTSAYCEALPACLSPARGGVLPGVVDVLESLHGRPDVLVALLTGNMRKGAVAKLECYGLRHYFAVGGFGDDGFLRPDIGRAALERARATAGELDLDRVYLVGDSPYDVSSARALGLRMIAVASGEHTSADLETDDVGAAGGGPRRPWWTLECLPRADEFSARLRLAPAATASRASLLVRRVKKRLAWR